MNLPGSKFSKNPTQLIPALLVIYALLGISAVPSFGQTALDEFRSVLSSSGSFTSDDFSALDRGEIVIKLLPVADKREVAVCGVTRLQGAPEVILKALNESMTQQNSKSIRATGRFSNPPTLADLETLSLEDRDIEDLKQCTVGRCKLKLSAAMIERFQQEVNWTAPDYKEQAIRLFRQMLLDYIGDYRARGLEALIEYQDQALPVSLRDEQHALLDESLYIRDFTPEFVSYFKRFPNEELPNVESYINWAKLQFGLKPVIIVTHVMTYRRSHNDARQILSLSNQIYANHYFDSSLALSMVMSFPKQGGVSDSYLLYSNHSRADSLGGSFSSIKRSIVESESIEKLEALLLQTKTNVEIVYANQSGAPPAPLRQTASEWLSRRSRPYALLLVFLAVLILIVLLLVITNRALFRRKGSSV